MTPSVFLQLLEEHTEDEVSQAIRVTQRAKVNNQIKTSAAGFFVQALKGGYLDQKEVETKKKAEQREQQEKAAIINAQIEMLKDEQAAKVNERIKEVTTENPSITNQAIEALQGNPIFKVVIQKKEKELGRPLDVEDYRQDRILREMVKGRIVELEKEKFNGILIEYEEKIKAVQEGMATTL